MDRYYRQAKAHLLLGQKSDALDVLARALRRKDLENDNNLVDLKSCSLINSFLVAFVDL